MWTPPERIKHEPAACAWPTAEEAERALLYQPIQVGPHTAKQRTWVPAMVPWRSTEEGFVTDDVIAWYERFARGKPGVIVIEATGIRDIASGPLLRIGHDRYLPGLRRLVDAVREASAGETLLFVQIIDFLQIRRRPSKEKYLGRFLQITDAHREQLRLTADDDVRAALRALDDDKLAEVLTEREFESLTVGYRERVTDTHLPQIRDLPTQLPTLFADAAARATSAGFHGVELHYAHAYTMASFLSARNTRDDGYGGSREHRNRLPLEVIAAVRERIGREGCLGARFLSDEVIDGGSRIDDATYFAVEFAKAGLDFLSLSKGGKFEDAKQPKVGHSAYPYTGPSGYECMPSVYSDARGPFCRNVGLSATIKKAVNEAGYKIPIVAAGGIGNFDDAERVLREGQGDIVGAARQSLADPDWFLKTRLGFGEKVRRCNYTNYCEALDQKHVPVTCKLWDRKELDEPGITKDKSGHRRLIAPHWKPGT